MAAGVIHKPGTDWGPCEEDCAHVDCAASREVAESTCRFCLGEIGYGRRFYMEGAGPVHASCLEDDAVEGKSL